MLISEEVLKKLILYKLSQQNSVTEAKEDRQYRRKMRRQRREELKAASTPEEKKAIRKKYREERKEMRDADKFEISDEGPSLKSLTSDVSTGDSVYDYVVSRINSIMPDINDIDQKYKGVRLVKMLKSRREKRFTIGQVKRFIKDGLLATKEKDYRLAADKFCAAYVFLETPKTPDRQVINVSDKTLDVLYELCKEFDGIISKRGDDKKIPSKKGGGASNTACVKDIQETLNALNATTPEVEQLAVDGKWGPKTSKAWNAACKANVTIGMQLNGVDVTGNIKEDILRDWTVAAPKLNYGADPCGARDFLGDVLKQRQEDPTPAPPPVDPDWGKRRSTDTQKAELDLEKLLTGEGLSINYVYTVEEFSTEYGSDDIQSLIQVGGTKSTNVLQGNTYDVERYPAGPDGNSTFSTALYYDQSKNMLVVDKVGDVAIRDIVLVGDKLYQKSLAPISETILKRGDDVLLNERALRRLIRQQIISEALNAKETEVLINSVVDELNAMAKDTDNFDAEQINAKMKAGQAAMIKNNFDEAKKQFKAAAAVADASSAKLDPAKKAQIKAVFTALANMAGSDDSSAGENAKSAVAKLKGGQAKKGSKKGGSSKVIKIQKQLNVLNNNDPKLKIDGSWGKNTSVAWQKALNSNIGKLEELSKEAVTQADTKKKWPELAKILSATDKKFAGNIDGVLDLLDVLRGQQSEGDSGEDKTGSKKASSNIVILNGEKFDAGYKGTSSGSEYTINLLRFPKAALLDRDFSISTVTRYSDLNDFVKKKPSGIPNIQLKVEQSPNNPDLKILTLKVFNSIALAGQQTGIKIQNGSLVIDAVRFNNYVIEKSFKIEGDEVVYVGPTGEKEAKST